MKIKIALAQLTPQSNVNEALQKGEEACITGQKNGAHLILFPELWQTGYAPDKMNAHNAIEPTHHYIKTFQQLAKNLKIAIGITYLQKDQSKLTNNFMLIDQKGQILWDYAKVHICNFSGGTEKNLSSGRVFPTASLTIDNQTVIVGGMICFDREFSEAARTLAAKGAEIILIPNACKLKTCSLLGDVRLAQLRARAFENMVGIAITNYPTPFQDGNSCFIDVDGQIFLSAALEETLLMGEFDLAAIRTWRHKEVWGMKNTCPDAYNI